LLVSPNVLCDEGKKGADHMSYLRAMKFNQQSVKSFYLRTHKQKLPAFTLSQETIQREKERGKEKPCSKCNRKKEDFRKCTYNKLMLSRPFGG
ncbi:MAG: hypothetical protein PWP42_43, partial [Candidatus Atribacteria bacterium]|nr:hypothetical protein [Candidatus Atribacteria bacterium]